MTLNTAFTSELDARIEQLKTDRVYKQMNYLDSPQSARVQMEGRGEVLILSSNNYLGLCDEPSVVEAGIRGLRRYGAGTASVRFICGTFTIHRELEEAIARFVGTEASLTYRGRLERERGVDVDDSRGRRLRRLRCTQPCIDHRLDPAREVDREVHERRVSPR